MLARDDIESYISDNYGSCDRGADCYWGKSRDGRWDGCLKIGWRGIACKHWHPVEGQQRDEIKTALEVPAAQR